MDEIGSRIEVYCRSFLLILFYEYLAYFTSNLHVNIRVEIKKKEK